MEILPIWKSHYSINKSILTLSNRPAESGPKSIPILCKNHDIKDVYLVDDAFTGFMEAYRNCRELDLNLRFGIRLTFCEDLNKKNADSLKTESKFIIFLTSGEGYESLCRIYSEAATTGFYYQPRTDFESIKKYWNPNLKLVIPFYDSFLLITL